MEKIPFEEYPPEGGMATLAVRYRHLVDDLEQAVAPRTSDFTRLRKEGERLMAWHRRVHNPYLTELEAIHHLGFLVYPMNGGLEYGCTTGMIQRRRNPVLWRTLDWPWAGMGGSRMGRGLIVVKMPGARPWYNITWPNFVGVANALAPGRFALAVNRAPSWYDVRPLQHRRMLLNNEHLSPLHLARQVMENAPDYDTARQWLLSRELCTTAIFTLVGTRPGEQSVIEHWSNKAVEVPDACAATNHWQAFPPNRVQPPDNSKDRLRAIKNRLTLGYIRPLGWLTDPVLFDQTVLAMEACPATGVLRVRGIERLSAISIFEETFEAA